MTKQEILDAIDDATKPGKMTKNEALEFIGDVRDVLEMRIESLLDEIEAEQR